MNSGIHHDWINAQFADLDQATRELEESQRPLAEQVSTLDRSVSYLADVSWIGVRLTHSWATGVARKRASAICKRFTSGRGESSRT